MRLDDEFEETINTLEQDCISNGMSVFVPYMPKKIKLFTSLTLNERTAYILYVIGYSISEIKLFVPRSDRTIERYIRTGEDLYPLEYGRKTKGTKKECLSNLSDACDAIV